MILLIAADFGVGKTYSALTSPTPSILLDLEDKAKLCKDRHFKNEEIEVINCVQYYKDKERFYKIDSVSTLAALDKNLSLLKDMMIEGEFKYRTIILDNISNLRTPFGVDEWLYYRPNRMSPKTKGDWRDINKAVEDRLFPLVNMCKANDIHLVLTSSLVDKYSVINTGEGPREVVVGKEIGVKDWIQQWCTHIVILEDREIGDKVSYIARVKKSPIGKYTIDITNKKLIEEIEKIEVSGSER